MCINNSPSLNIGVLAAGQLRVWLRQFALNSIFCEVPPTNEII